MIQSCMLHCDHFDVILRKFAHRKEVQFYPSVSKIKKRIPEISTFTTQHSENIFYNQWAKYAIRKINRTVNIHVIISYIFNGITNLELETRLVNWCVSDLIFIIVCSLQHSSADIWARCYMCKFIYFMILWSYIKGKIVTAIK